jgi:hypothetical protein
VPHPNAGNIPAVWDNQGVVNAYREGVTPQLAKMAKHSGLWRSIAASTDKVASLEMHKVKSHQKLADVHEDFEKILVTINAVADEAATQAHELFPTFADAAKTAAIEKAELKIVAIHCARALALYVTPGNPALGKSRFNFEMAPKGKRYVKPVDSSHPLAFDFTNKRWVCQACRCTFAPGQATTIATQPCLLLAPGLRSVLSERHLHGHKLYMAECDGKPLLFCAHCHGFSSGMRRKLGEACQPSRARTGYGVTAGKRFWNQKHPTDARPITRPEPVPDDSQIGDQAVSDFIAAPVISADGRELMQAPGAVLFPADDAEELPCIMEGVFSDEEDPFHLGPVSP